MALPEGSTDAAEAFGRLVVRRKWAEILPLFAAALQSKHTPQSVQAEFGWKALAPRLRGMHIERTGEPEDIVPELDPPKRFEVFEVEEREPPSSLAPSVPFGWVEVDFLPSEDSEFDVCYTCFLAFVDESGPRIAEYAIESATE